MGYLAFTSSVQLLGNDIVQSNMAKKITPLTHTQIDKTKPTAKTQKLYDGMGLYLEISPKGTNTWRLKYNKLYLNSQDTYTIGRYPAISLLEARKEHQKYLELLAKHIDPKSHAQAIKTQEQNKVSFATFTKEYLAERQTLVKPNTHKEDIKRANKDVLPHLSNIPIHGVNKAHVKAMADNIESRKRNDIPPRETTRRIIDLVISILKRAQQKGLIDDVASKHLRNEYPKLKSEHFKYLDLPNLPALLKDIDNYTGDI